MKLATAYPNNNRIELPSVSAVYVTFDAAQGQALAMIDGLTLTTRQTAAASALAARASDASPVTVTRPPGTALAARSPVKYQRR